MAIDPYKAPDSEVAWGQSTPVAAEDQLPAPHGKRWLAAFLDNIIVAVPALTVFVVLLVAVEELAGNDGLIEAFTLGLQVLLVGVQVLYGAAFESSGWQATPGKKLMGLVVHRADGEPLSFGAALGRNVAKFVSLSMCGLVAIAVLIDDDNRGVWDMIVHSRVTSKNPYAS